MKLTLVILKGKPEYMKLFLFKVTTNFHFFKIEKIFLLSHTVLLLDMGTRSWNNPLAYNWPKDTWCTKAEVVWDCRRLKIKI